MAADLIYEMSRRRDPIFRFFSKIKAVRPHAPTLCARKCLEHVARVQEGVVLVSPFPNCAPQSIEKSERVARVNEPKCLFFREKSVACATRTAPAEQRNPAQQRSSAEAVERVCSRLSPFGFDSTHRADQKKWSSVRIIIIVIIITTTPHPLFIFSIGILSHLTQTKHKHRRSDRLFFVPPGRTGSNRVALLFIDEPHPATASQAFRDHPLLSFGCVFVPSSPTCRSTTSRRARSPR